MYIPVIDIFAGPGGLGEGFSAAEGSHRFHIKLSVEMDKTAHETLQLRSFLRAFGYGNFPDEYYRYIKDPEYSKKSLFEAYPKEAAQAENEAWKAELGKEQSSDVHSKIRTAVGGSKYWVLLGGPPCQAYSLVGRARRTGIGTENGKLSRKKQEELRREKLKLFKKDKKHTLHKEYLKIVAVHKPTIFVMENVKGILSSMHADEPVFERILSDLHDPWKAIDNDKEMKKDDELQKLCRGKKPMYQLFSFTKKGDDDLVPQDFIIKAEDYGIPQKRHRVIILGVLSDYDIKPKVLEKSETPVTVKQALNSLPKLRSGLSAGEDSTELWRDCIRQGFTQCRLSKFENREIISTIKSALSEIKNVKSRGGAHVTGRHRAGNSQFNHWVKDPYLDGVIQHETRAHMTSDLWRYLFSASFSKVNNCSPKIENFPKWLLPEHKNVHKKDGSEIHFKDRFKVQLAEEPATTITSHIAKDGHYYIHYDPSQCRSLTVREAARLQTFPDNYFFEGHRTQQYQQIGNAVPPLLASKLAKIVADVMRQCRNMDEIKDKSSKKNVSIGVDVHTPEQRSKNMSRIRSKNTTPELRVRSALHKAGYRFRLHRKDVPGNPDIVMLGKKLAIFVHGCFWHRHPDCRYAYRPKTRVEFWQKKFQSNMKRDRIVIKQLAENGWKQLIIWECETKNKDNLEKVINQFFEK